MTFIFIQIQALQIGIISR